MFREMRRKNQQISDEECKELLRSAKRGVLAVFGEDEYPYAMPLNFVYENGHIYFHGAKSGHKLDAIKKHDKVSFCILDEGRQEENSWWFHFTSVVAFGRLQEVEDPEAIYRYLLLLGRKYFPDEAYLEEEMKSAPRTAVLDLSIEHMTGKRVKEK